MAEQMRYHCRRCKLQLDFTPQNERERFCTRGCFRMFYGKICIVCEEGKSGQGASCTRPTCRTELAAIKRHGVGGRYLVPGWQHARSGTPISIGSDPAPKVDPRPYLWTRHGITKPRTIEMYGWDRIAAVKPHEA